METHFRKRQKCPDGFNLVNRSYPSVSKVGRGGAAVYIKSSSDIRLHTYEYICPDAVIFEVTDTNTVIVAPYITPENSKYKEKDIFNILDYIIKNFRNQHIIITADLNSRCATPASQYGYVYKENPDKVVNPYGKKLITLCKNNDLTLINGLIHMSNNYDSDFTYFRGSLKSQNDWCITNQIDNLKSFNILPKLKVSDHCPCAISIDLKQNHHAL